MHIRWQLVLGITLSALNLGCGPTGGGMSGTPPATGSTTGGIPEVDPHDHPVAKAPVKPIPDGPDHATPPAAPEIRPIPDGDDPK